MSTIEIALTDEETVEARKMGLFDRKLATSIFREELRKRRTNRFFSMIDQLADGAEPMSDEEVMAEVRAVRAERKQRAK